MVNFNDYCYLYVEDDANSREVLGMIMDLVMGVEQVVFFEDSADFTARLAALPCQPDVILLDVNIAPHNGFEMLAAIRADRRYDAVHVLALTASVMSDEIDRLRSSGFDGAIAKPVSLSTFPNMIAQVLNGGSVWHVS